MTTEKVPFSASASRQRRAPFRFRLAHAKKAPALHGTYYDARSPLHETATRQAAGRCSAIFFSMQAAAVPLDADDDGQRALHGARRRLLARRRIVPRWPRRRAEAAPAIASAGQQHAAMTSGSCCRRRRRETASRALPRARRRAHQRGRWRHRAAVLTPASAAPFSQLPAAFYMAISMKDIAAASSHFLQCPILPGHTTNTIGHRRSMPCYAAPLPAHLPTIFAYSGLARPGRSRFRHDALAARAGPRAWCAADYAFKR